MTMVLLKKEAPGTSLFANVANTEAAVNGLAHYWVNKDVAAAEAWLAEDFMLWNNIEKREMRRKRAMDLLRTFSARAENVRQSEIRRFLTPDGLVEQSLFSFEWGTDRFADIPLLAIYTMRGRLVARCEIYVDATGLPALTEGAAHV